MGRWSSARLTPRAGKGRARPGRDGAALRRSGAGAQRGWRRRLLVPTAAWRRPRERRQSRRHGRQSPSRSRSRARTSWRRAARWTVCCGSRSASSRAGSASTVRGAGAGSGGKLPGPNFFLPFFFSPLRKLPIPQGSEPAPSPARSRSPGARPAPRLPFPEVRDAPALGAASRAFVCPSPRMCARHTAAGRAERSRI